MDKVVYILGAGFSAPLGIPVMGNFLFKSKDLYFSDETKFPHFSEVFDTIKELSVAKNYYQSDLFNIEEILSILEMKEFLEGHKLKDEFIQYIRDVITNYTPELPNLNQSRAGNWEDFLFGSNAKYPLYGYFISAVIRLMYQRELSDSAKTSRAYDFTANTNPHSQTKYAILSLNYDLVPETVNNFISSNYISKSDISFEKKEYDPTWNKCHLIKLHGCVDDGSIVPPTWAKGTHQGIIPIWKNAYRILQDATHIRFIGYSLPTSDSYLKYLLKAAVIDTPHLKSIDVITLDKDNEAKDRYDEFFEFTNYKFKNASVTDYFHELETIIKRAKPISKGQSVSCDVLEEAHEKFMTK
jgi:hypothetical protein